MVENTEPVVAQIYTEAIGEQNDEPIVAQSIQVEAEIKVPITTAL